MNHTPYEDWLLEDPNLTGKGLSTEEHADLQDHLAQCPACQRMYQALWRVEDQLNEARMLQPAKGFRARWLARLEIDIVKKHRDQSLRLFGLSAGLALGLAIFLIYLTWPVFRTPTVLLWASVYQVLRWLSLANLAQEFLSNISVAANLNVPFSLWVFAVGMVCLICVLWLVSYRYLTNPRRVTK